MIFQACSSIGIALLGLWFAWSELGMSVFGKPVTWLLLMVWLWASINVFSLRWEESKNRATDEKVDDLIVKIDSLISEIRQDRAELKRLRKKGMG